MPYNPFSANPPAKRNASLCSGIPDAVIRDLDSLPAGMGEHFTKSLRAFHD